MAEVRPPPGSSYGTLQAGGIDLRQSVLVSFQLKPSLSVSGLVTQLLGSPVSGASVTFSARSAPIPGRRPQATASVAAGGLFSTRLPANTWDALVVPPAPLPPLAEMLGLSASTTALQFELPSASSLLRVQATVTAGGQPLAGARVLAVDANGNLLAAAANADVSGNAQLLLAPGTTSIYLRAGPAPSANSSSGGAQAALYPSWDAAGPIAIDASSGTAMIAQDLPALPASATLSGTVRDASGSPLAGARVYALSLDGNGYTLSANAPTGTDGSWTMTLAAGNFAVEAAPPSSAADAALSGEQDLTLPADGTQLQLTCPPVAHASGTVLQASGMPAPEGTQISATRLPDRLISSRVAQTQPTDASGAFTLAGDPGTYRLAIAPPASSGLAGALVEVMLAEGTTTLPALALSQPLQVVGTVTGNAGAPIAGATVELFAPDASGQSALSLGSGLTDSSGQFTAIVPDVAQP